jgi:predicted RNA-binding Zn-ribbon protein involved in translation (DUF1610 family)
MALTIPLCPKCVDPTPIIQTFRFNGAEYWCPCCGHKAGMFDDFREAPYTKELEELKDSLWKLSKKFRQSEDNESEWTYLPLSAKRICTCLFQNPELHRDQKCPIHGKYPLVIMSYYEKLDKDICPLCGDKLTVTKNGEHKDCTPCNKHWWLRDDDNSWRSTYLNETIEQIRRLKDIKKMLEDGLVDPILNKYELKLKLED